ncbi:ABC transporter ATP-binding protein [Acidisphaera sp. L21]|uniref:ABC transporter ATP-binding protein n=1 Tax=Acidisphaera sp. L21 TaxID=1641851 RepID=UPI001C20B873|nr:ABC transporter ATP-binding protein [Acidisphaera sp. L21]
MAELIAAANLTKHYPTSRTTRQMLRGERPVVRAVDGIDLVIQRGESVGLVGESGSGKTTVGRLLLKLTEASGGTLNFDGAAVSGLSGDSLRRFRQQAQLVFQNPFDSVNPRFTIRRAVAEPLINTGVPRAERDGRIAEAMRLVHLGDFHRYADKHPSELSGGQLQRVVLARALVGRPSFLVADEPVSMLDVSVRAGILNLMRELRDRLGLTALYISHDLTLVRYVCERTLVMYLGRIVEDGPTSEVISRPAHPYTQALIKAVPRPRTDQSREDLPISGGLANAVSPPSGCRLRDRCPYAFARCAQEVPALLEVAPGHRAACHLTSPANAAAA